jgi:hypothetical protein
MEFLYISSLGVAYQYVVKIERKFNKNNKKDFGSEKPSQYKPSNGVPNSQGKGQSNDR